MGWEPPFVALVAGFLVVAAAIGGTLAAWMLVAASRGGSGDRTA